MYVSPIQPFMPLNTPPISLFLSTAELVIKCSKYVPRVMTSLKSHSFENNPFRKALYKLENLIISYFLNCTGAYYIHYYYYSICIMQKWGIYISLQHLKIETKKKKKNIFFEFRTCSIEQGVFVVSSSIRGIDYHFSDDSPASESHQRRLQWKESWGGKGPGEGGRKEVKKRL